MERELDDQTLMRYLDGELDRAQARDAERAVAASPELRAKVQALGQLREILGAHTRAAQDEAEPRLDALWEKIRAGIEAQPARTRVRERASWWSGVRQWFEAYRAHFLTGAMAAAAGALIASFAGARGRVVEKVVYRPEPPTAVAVATPAEVESLEVGNGTATILQMPGDRVDDPGTTVI